MGKLETATLTITEDEPCWLLREYDEPVMGVSHRFQEVRVIRDGKVAVWLDELGLSSQFAADPFVIPCGQLFPDHRIEVYHNVGQARDMADRQRSKPLPDSVLADEPNWAQMFADDVDRQRMEARKQSIFGPQFRKMRY